MAENESQRIYAEPKTAGESKIVSIENTYEDHLLDALQDDLLELDDLINSDDDTVGLGYKRRAVAVRKAVQDRIEYVDESDDPDDK